MLVIPSHPLRPAHATAPTHTPRYVTKLLRTTCRLIWEWSKDGEAAHTAVLLVSGVLRRAPQPPGVLRAALTAAATTGAPETTQRFFDELRRTPGELDGQAYGLLISAYGKVRPPRTPVPLLALHQTQALCFAVVICQRHKPCALPWYSAIRWPELCSFGGSVW